MKITSRFAHLSPLHRLATQSSATRQQEASCMLAFGPAAEALMAPLGTTSATEVPRRRHRRGAFFAAGRAAPLARLVRWV